MPRVLVIHHDRSIRSTLETLAKPRYEAESARHLTAGLKKLAKSKPDVVVVGQDNKKQEGIRLLRWMRDNVLKLPVVVVAAPEAGAMQPMAMKLGAKAFLEYPVSQDHYKDAIGEAIRRHKADLAPPPPLTTEELKGNLSLLEQKLNKEMVCFAGRNQVYIQSRITGGHHTKPRICLKCGLRGEFGLNRDVYYEFIRDVCCGDPGQCEAVQLYRARESA